MTKFSNDKKNILKEYINIVDNPVKLKEFYNTKVNEIKTKLSKLNKSTKNKVTKIKIDETLNLLTELDKNAKVNNDHVVNLLQYCDLLEELKINHNLNFVAGARKMLSCLTGNICQLATMVVRRQLSYLAHRSGVQWVKPDQMTTNRQFSTNVSCLILS